MTIRDLSEVNTALAPYISRTALLTDKDLKLERVSLLLGAVGDPHKDLKVIHIAGTSGKTSTSYYMAALLRASGKRVGLTVSPHVDGINERVQVDGAPLSADLFCKELGEFLDKVEGVVDSPSYFELLTAFAFWVFKRQGVDYAVLETGLGGMYDATNVATRRDKVCIITDIGFDHMHILGNKLSQIAAQKAGIIHKGNHVFMYKQATDIMRSIRSRVSKHQANLKVLDENAERRVWKKDLADMAGYQQRNWLLAYSAYRYLESRDGLKNLSHSELLGVQNTRIPGRMDVRNVNGKMLIMDGAHNGQKMAAFISSFQRLHPGVKPAVLISLRDTKDYHDLVPLLMPFAGRIITTAFQTSQDSLVQSMDADELAQAFIDQGMSEVQAIDNHAQAFQVLLSSPEPVFTVTGSFYLLSQIRNSHLP